MVDKNIIQSRFTKLGVVPIDNQHYLYATLDNNLIGIIVNTSAVDFFVRKATTSGSLYPIKHIGYASIEVLVWLVIALRKHFIVCCFVVQKRLNGLLEVFCTFHNYSDLSSL